MVRDVVLSCVGWSFAVGAWWMASADMVVAEDRSPTQIVDAFVASLQQNDAIAEDDRQQALAAIRRLRQDERTRDSVITEGLRLAYPPFKDALKALGDERYPDALRVLDELANTEDRFLVAAAMLYRVRAYSMQQRHDEALGLLQDLAANYRNDTLQMPEIVYLTAVAEARLLQREDAIGTLKGFLQQYPEASRRLRDAAIAQLEKLQEIDFSLLDDVHDKMSFSLRQLTKEDSGPQTQRVQENVVALLTELISEIERKGGA